MLLFVIPVHNCIQPQVKKKKKAALQYQVRMKSGVYPIETTHSGCQTYLTHPRKHRHTHFTLHTWDESHRLAWSPLRCRCNNSLCNTMKTPGCVPVTDAGTLTHMQWVLSHSLHSQTFYCWYKVRNLRSGLLRSPPLQLSVGNKEVA